MPALLLLLLLHVGACGVSPEGTILDNTAKPPSISGFAPAEQGIGLAVTVYGSNFGTSAQLVEAHINGTTATVASALNDSITVLVPAEATSGLITVSTAAGTANSSSSLIVRGDTAPVITDFSPVTGAVGASVTITGANFDDSADYNEVFFNGSPATVTSAAESSLTVTVPEATSGNIRVVTLAGSATSARVFRLIEADDGTTPAITSFTPLRGSVGDAVTITGLNFDSVEGNNRVEFNDVEATITSASATSISVTAPDTTSGTITVTTPGGVAHSEAGFELLPAGGYTTAAGLMGGTIQSAPLSLAGAVTTFAGGGIAGAAVDGIGSDARFDNPIGIASDGANLYIADSNNRMIRQLVISTSEVTTLAGSGELGSADGTGLLAEFMSPNGVVAEGGNLYVTDSSDNKIRKIVISTGEVTTFAGSGSYATTDGTGILAAFKSPYGIATDGTNLYVADSGGNTIRQIEIATGVVTTLAGSGAFAATDGTGAAASFYRPHGIACDGVNLYIADTSSHKIRKLVIATGEVTTFAGSGATGSADGIGTAAEFHTPDRIATDGLELFVTDAGNHKIRRIVISSGEVTTLAGSGAPGHEDETGTAATFSDPKGIVVEGLNLYVADSGKVIRRIEIATGAVTTVAGDAGTESTINGIGTAAVFNKPGGITTDGTNLYVADSYHRLIRKIAIANAKVYTLAGSGFLGAVDATATSASFNYPMGITTDGASLFVSDSQNHKIRKIVLATGAVTTFAGSGSPGAVDGTGLLASFREPTGITTDGINLYVADSLNHKIRKIEISSGVVSTLAGSGEQGSADGAAEQASFSRPEGITTDGAALYIADSGNNIIRRIALSTGEVTTLAGSGEFWSGDGTGADAGFRYPQGITTDGGYLFVTDSFGRSIRQIVISTGLVTTLAGSGDEGTADGTGTVADFILPFGITSDGTSLFVTDYLSHQIRKID